jgi:catechol 2,3-dioxygenase-like lactoylglutathione lyase family enzyme
MLETGKVIAFVGSADLGQARVFYERTLGLRMIERNEFACVFDANGTMLRVTAVAEVMRAGYTVLGWQVSDIAAVVRGLTAKGVAFLRYAGMDQDESGVWTTPGGDQVAWFADPGGNVLSLTQFAL